MFSETSVPSNEQWELLSDVFREQSSAAPWPETSERETPELNEETWGRLGRVFPSEAGDVEGATSQEFPQITDKTWRALGSVVSPLETEEPLPPETLGELKEGDWNDLPRGRKTQHLYRWRTRRDRGAAIESWQENLLEEDDERKGKQEDREVGAEVVEERVKWWGRVREGLQGVLDSVPWGRLQRLPLSRAQVVGRLAEKGWWLGEERLRAVERDSLREQAVPWLVGVLIGAGEGWVAGTLMQESPEFELMVKMSAALVAEAGAGLVQLGKLEKVRELAEKEGRFAKAAGVVRKVCTNRSVEVFQKVVAGMGLGLALEGVGHYVYDVLAGGAGAEGRLEAGTEQEEAGGPPEVGEMETAGPEAAEPAEMASLEGGEGGAEPPAEAEVEVGVSPDAGGEEAVGEPAVGVEPAVGPEQVGVDLPTELAVKDLPLDQQLGASHWRLAERWSRSLADQFGLSEAARTFLTDAVKDITQDQGTVQFGTVVRYDPRIIGNYLSLALERLEGLDPAGFRVKVTAEDIGNLKKIAESLVSRQ